MRSRPPHSHTRARAHRIDHDWRASPGGILIQLTCIAYAAPQRSAYGMRKSEHHELDELRNLTYDVCTYGVFFRGWGERNSMRSPAESEWIVRSTSTDRAWSWGYTNPSLPGHMRRFFFFFSFFASFRYGRAGLSWDGVLGKGNGRGARMGNFSLGVSGMGY